MGLALVVSFLSASCIVGLKIEFEASFYSPKGKK